MQLHRIAVRTATQSTVNQLVARVGEDLRGPQALQVVSYISQNPGHRIRIRFAMTMMVSNVNRQILSNWETPVRLPAILESQIRP